MRKTNWRVVGSIVGLALALVAPAAQAIPFAKNLGPHFDYEGDGKSDIARFDSGLWRIRLSTTAEDIVVGWGSPGDVPVAGDFDGDGRTDIAVWRPIEGYWHIINSSNGSVSSIHFGDKTDTPLKGADFDGDGRADIGVWRGGMWYFIKSASGQFVSVGWGGPTDLPVPGDYDGDGKTDVAIYRLSERTFHIIKSSNGAVWSFNHGYPGIPATADYDGDGKTDFATASTNSTGTGWMIRSSLLLNNIAPPPAFPHGTPIPSDYDGDGKADVTAVNITPWRGDWTMIPSTTRQVISGILPWNLKINPVQSAGQTGATCGIYGLPSCIYDTCVEGTSTTTNYICNPIESRTIVCGDFSAGNVVGAARLGISNTGYWSFKGYMHNAGFWGQNVFLGIGLSVVEPVSGNQVATGYGDFAGGTPDTASRDVAFEQTSYSTYMKEDWASFASASHVCKMHSSTNGWLVGEAALIGLPVVTTQGAFMLLTNGSCWDQSPNGCMGSWDANGNWQGQ